MLHSVVLALYKGGFEVRYSASWQRYLCFAKTERMTLCLCLHRKRILRKYCGDQYQRSKLITSKIAFISALLDPHLAYDARQRYISVNFVTNMFIFLPNQCYAVNLQINLVFKTNSLSDKTRLEMSLYTLIPSQLLPGTVWSLVNIQSHHEANCVRKSRNVTSIGLELGRSLF